MVEEKRFRPDLYYRLNVVPMTIPPLREREEDIPLLAEYFLSQLNEKYHTQKVLSPQLLKKFIENNWPGNVRQLKNVVERLILVSPGDMLKESEFRVSKNGETKRNKNENTTGQTNGEIEEQFPLLKDALEEREKELVLKAYKEYKNIRRTGEVLGISHTAVLRKLKKYQAEVNKAES